MKISEKEDVSKTIPSQVLHPTFLPPWACLNSPDSLPSRILLPSGPEVLPPTHQMCSSNLDILANVFFTWYLMARLWGSSYQTWKFCSPSLHWKKSKSKYFIIIFYLKHGSDQILVLKHWSCRLFVPLSSLLSQSQPLHNLIYNNIDSENQKPVDTWLYGNSLPAASVQLQPLIKIVSESD